MITPSMLDRFLESVEGQALREGHRYAQEARVAAFNGRNSPPHFFWGDIAQQLGRASVFQEFWSSGPKAPDEKAWLKLFDGKEAILILLDEMPPYFEDLAPKSPACAT